MQPIIHAISIAVIARIKKIMSKSLDEESTRFLRIRLVCIKNGTVDPSNCRYNIRTKNRI